MPYDPNPKVDKNQLVAEQRVRIYWLTLVSGAAIVLALMLHLLAIDIGIMSGPLIGIVAGSLMMAGIRGYTDDYYQQLVAVGMRWTMATLGVLVLVFWAHGQTSLIARLLPGVSWLEADAYGLVLLLGAAFHVGYSFAYLRDIATRRSGQ